MLHFNILTQLEETVWPTPKREAYLYSFNEESYNELKQKGFRLEF
jgi:8-oxo-dGTP diphosphatase